MSAEEKDEFAEALDLITKWIERLRDYPGFNDWKRASIAATMTYGDPFSREIDDRPDVFVFPQHILKQHDAITAFFGLHTTWQALADTEFYFRRFPFQNLPVSLDSHLRYTCETYFSRIYEFSERLKKCLNALNNVIPQRIDAGAIIKLFGKDFRQEIKERNFIHHHAAFEEIMIDRIRIEGMMALNTDGRGDRGWKQEQRRTYRKASREWAERAMKRSALVRQYLNAVAKIVTEQCTFLGDPITIEPR